MPMKVRIASRRLRRAVAAVEMAILLPFVLVPLALGIWEMGRIVQVQQVLDNAAREGARQASTGEKTNSQVITAVKQYITDAGLNSANANVTVTNVTSGTDAASASQLDHLTISITLPYSDVAWTTVSDFVTQGTNLTASADWYSMKDSPLTVSQTIPTQPQ
jgi:Flp pilus assembly protein TadG